MYLFVIVIGNLQETCISQREQLQTLQPQFAAAQEKLKASNRRTITSRESKKLVSFNDGKETKSTTLTLVLL